MFRVTYEIVTPESAEAGDVEETGFVTPGGWRTPIAAAMADDDRAAYDMDLRSALSICSPAYDAGRWFSEEPWVIDFATGADETRRLHPPKNITPSSYRRISRLLGISKD